METKALKLFREYEETALRAFEHLRLEDTLAYTAALREAERISRRARAALRAEEFKIFRAGCLRTLNALRKCTALGLRNLKRRLAEFRVAEDIAHRLKDRSHVRREGVHVEAVMAFCG